jgi:hypothetical protein
MGILHRMLPDLVAAQSWGPSKLSSKLGESRLAQLLQRAGRLLLSFLTPPQPTNELQAVQSGRFTSQDL